MKSLIQLCHLLPVVSSIAVFGCGAAPDSDGDRSEDVGEVSLALTTVPTGVQCIQVAATGSTTVTKNFTVTAGSSGVNALALGALPVGSATITGKAYNVACASISGQTPTWIADTLSISVQAGVVTSPAITFRPNNTVTATANFVGNVVQVASSYNAIDVVYSDGTVRGAGNQSPLGLGTLKTFTSLSSLTNVASLALGRLDFGCEQLKTGSVSCWGTNSGGQLGNGTTNSSTTPVAVSGMTNVVQTVAGSDHACALKSDGTLWCWGSNSSGQVGNGSSNNATSPVQILTGVSSVAAHDAHTCALQNGSVRCWGQILFERGAPITTTPTYVPNLAAVTQLVAGCTHTCALRADGDVFCWGDNVWGDLGYGDNIQRLDPITTPVLTDVQQLSAADYGTCALLKSGNVLCWGSDIVGEVGDGSGNTALSPTNVANNYASFTALFSSGGSTNCGVGVDAKVYCWGYNGGSQFGNGNLNDVWIPTALGI